MKLTNEDIKKLKYEKRTGYVFSLIFVSIAGLCNIFYFSSGSFSINASFIISINILVFVITILISAVINRKINKDLREENKISKIETVVDKENEIIYEAGSGALNSSIPGYFFPKLWKQPMKPNKRYYLRINNYRFDVDQSLYENIEKGDSVIMYYSKYSDILLGIEKNNSWP